MIDYQMILNIKYKKYVVEIIFLVILTVFLSISYAKYSYSVFETKGIIKDDYLLVNLPITNSDTINRSEFLVIKGNSYSFSIESVDELFINGEYYYSYKILVDYTFFDKEVLNLYFYYDYESILFKIYKLIF